MAEYLPIRAYNRSQKVRIGNEIITSTQTHYIDISDLKIRKQYGYHSAIGAVIPVGDLRAHNKPFAVWSGCTVSEGVADTDRTITVAAGSLRLEDGTYVTVAAQDLDISDADASEDRIDIIVIDDEGTASIIEGTASADPEAPDEGDDVLLAYVDVLAAGGTDEVQRVTLTAATGGTFTLTFDGQTTAAIAYDAAASAVRTALEALSNIAPGDVAVSGSAGGPYTVTFGGQYDEEDVDEMTASDASLLGTNEVQEVRVDATSGAYRLTYSAQTTGDIDFDADATGVGSVQEALEALSNIEVGDVAVTGGPGDSGGTTPYVVTFEGDLANRDVAEMTADNGTLAGGGAAVTVTTSTAGVDPSIAVATSTAGETVGVTDSEITDARERV